MIARLLKQLISVLWHGTPWALGLLFHVIFYTFRISILLILRWRGAVPEASRRFADDWVARAKTAGFPSVWEPELRGAFFILAFLSFYLGWTFALFSVVMAFNWLLFGSSF